MSLVCECHRETGIHQKESHFKSQGICACNSNIVQYLTSVPRYGRQEEIFTTHLRPLHRMESPYPCFSSTERASSTPLRNLCDIFWV